MLLRTLRAARSLQPPPGMPSELTTRTAKLAIDEYGILQVVQAPGSEQTFADADETVKASIELAGSKRWPMLVDMSGVKSIDRAARGRYARPDNQESVYALALVVGNPLNRMIGNFFIGLNKAPVPTRLFGSRREARQWLLAQKDSRDLQQTG